jgi:hypothetical protein
MLKITMKTTKIISDSLKKNKKQMEKKKWETKKKWTKGGRGWFYTTILPTSSPMKNLNNIILHFSVGNV